jgi:hypothetical protein
MIEFIAKQQEPYCAAAVHPAKGNMKVALASRYRNLMLVLFPATLGLGTAMLWLRSLSWPLRVDDAGMTLRHRGRVEWASIRKIGLSRSYLDGRVSKLRIHYARGTCTIPVRGLEDGQEVARIIIAMFEHAKRARRARTDRTPGRDNIGDQEVIPNKWQAVPGDDFRRATVDVWAQELATLRETLARRTSEKHQGPTQLTRNGYDGYH